MKLTDMQAVLEAEGIRLTKALGQNFLHDGNHLRRIVAAAALSPGDRVLEIGPGLGPLTERLLGAGARVLAIEKDARLVRLLRQKWSGEVDLELVQGDALEWLRRTSRGWEGWKVVSNLPYSVGTPILVALSQSTAPPDRMVVTLQWEVGERLTAVAGSDAYGVLTLLVGLNYTTTGVFRIPASCFFPAPQVDSACVCLERRPTSLLTAADAARFGRLVKRAFSQRRKMMVKLLRGQWPQALLLDAFGLAGVDARARGEQVSLDQFVTLTAHLGEESRSRPEGTPLERHGRRDL